MNKGLLNQLDAYFSDLEEQQGVITEADVSKYLGAVRAESGPIVTPARPRQRPWLALAAGAVAVLLAAIPLGLDLLDGDEVTATSAAPTTVDLTVAPTTSLGTTENDPAGPSVEWTTYPRDGVTAPGPYAIPSQGDGQFLAYESSLIEGGSDVELGPDDENPLVDPDGDPRTLLWRSDDGLEWTSHHLEQFDGMNTDLVGEVDGRYVLIVDLGSGVGSDRIPEPSVWISSDLVAWDRLDDEGAWGDFLHATDDRILFDSSTFFDRDWTVFDRGWTNPQSAQVGQSALGATGERFYVTFAGESDGLPAIFSSVDGIDWEMELDADDIGGSIPAFAASSDSVLVWTGAYEFWFAGAEGEFRKVSGPPGFPDRPDSGDITITATNGHFFVTAGQAWVTTDGTDWVPADAPLPFWRSSNAASVGDVVLAVPGRHYEAGGTVWMRGVVSADAVARASADPVEENPAGPIEWVTYPRDGVTAPGPDAELRQGDGQFLAYKGSLRPDNATYVTDEAGNTRRLGPPAGPYDDPRTLLWTSADGLEWTSHHLEQFDGMESSLVGEVDGRYLLNVHASDESGPPAIVWMSTDLVNWEPLFESPPEAGAYAYDLYSTDERILFRGNPFTVFDRGWTNPQPAEGSVLGATPYRFNRVFGATRDLFYAEFFKGEKDVEGHAIFSSSDGIEWTFEFETTGPAPVIGGAFTQTSVLIWTDDFAGGGRFWFSDEGGEFQPLPRPSWMGDGEGEVVHIATIGDHFVVNYTEWVDAGLYTSAREHEPRVTTNGSEWALAASPAFLTSATVRDTLVAASGSYRLHFTGDEDGGSSWNSFETDDFWMRGVISP